LRLEYPPNTHSLLFEFCEFELEFVVLEKKIVGDVIESFNRYDLNFHIIIIEF